MKEKMKLNEKFFFHAVALWKENSEEAEKKFLRSLFLFNLAGLLLVLIVHCGGWCCVCYFIEHIINIISIILWSIFNKTFCFHFVFFLYISSLQLMFCGSFKFPITAGKNITFVGFLFIHLAANRNRKCRWLKCIRASRKSSAVLCCLTNYKHVTANSRTVAL